MRGGDDSKAGIRMMAQQIDKTATEMTDSFSETAVRVTRQVSDVNRVIGARRRPGLAVRCGDERFAAA